MNTAVASIALPLGAFLLTLGEWVQGIGLAVLVVGFAVATPSRRAMKVWRDNADAEKARADRLEQEIVGATARANTEAEQRAQCQREISHLEGQLKTMERYTAQNALEAVARELHTTREAIVGAIEAQGELVLKNTEILASLRQRLDPKHDQPL